MDDACLVFKTAFDWLTVLITDRLLLKDNLGPSFAPFLVNRTTIEAVMELVDYPFPRQQSIIRDIVHRTLREYNVSLSHYLIYKELISSIGEKGTENHLVDRAMLKKSLEHYKIAETTDCLPIYYIYKEVVESTPLTSSHFYYYKDIQFYSVVFVALLACLAVSVCFSDTLLAMINNFRL